MAVAWDGELRALKTPSTPCGAHQHAAGLRYGRDRLLTSADASDEAGDGRGQYEHRDHGILLSNPASSEVGWGYGLAVWRAASRGFAWETAGPPRRGGL